jgi:Tfp pilus assembly protein PilF
VQFLLYRIELLQRTGARLKEVYETYERVITLDPRNLSVLNNYAYLLATHGGDLRKAEQMSQITIHDEPNNPVYLDTYGWIMHLQGQEQLAQFYLNKALWNATDDVRAEIVEHLQKLKK